MHNVVFFVGQSEPDLRSHPTFGPPSIRDLAFKPANGRPSRALGSRW